MRPGGLAYALAQLSDRERVLLLIFAILIIPVAIIFLAVIPLMDAKDRAERSAIEARTTLDWVVGQVEIMPADIGTDTASSSSNITAIGLSGLEDSLVQSGLRDQVSQLANRADGGIDLALEDVEFTGLSIWLSDMASTWGYTIAAFRFEAASPGIVHARFELMVAQ